MDAWLLMLVGLALFVAALPGLHARRSGRAMGRRARGWNMAAGVVILVGLAAATASSHIQSEGALPHAVSLPDPLLAPGDSSVPARGGAASFGDGRVLATLLLFRDNVPHRSRLAAMDQQAIALRDRQRPAAITVSLEVAGEGWTWELGLDSFREAGSSRVDFRLDLEQYAGAAKARQVGSLSTGVTWEDFTEPTSLLALGERRTSVGIHLGLLPRGRRELAVPLLHLQWLPASAELVAIAPDAVAGVAPADEAALASLDEYLQGLSELPIEQANPHVHGGARASPSLPGGITLAGAYGINVLLLAVAVVLIANALPKRCYGILLLSAACLGLLVVVDRVAVGRAWEDLRQPGAPIARRLDGLAVLRRTFFFEASARRAAREAIEAAERGATDLEAVVVAEAHRTLRALR